MDPLKSKDTKFALGAVTGGTASLIGHGATALVGKALTIKFAGTAAIKAGAALAAAESRLPGRSAAAGGRFPALEGAPSLCRRRRNGGKGPYGPFRNQFLYR